MSAITATDRVADFAPPPGVNLVHVIGVVLLALDIVLVAATGFAADVIYHGLIWGERGSDYAAWSAFGVATIFAILQLSHGAYRPKRLLERHHQFRSARYDWLITFPIMLVLTFLAKDATAFSRGAMLIFFLLGFPVLYVVRRLTHVLVLHATLHGNLRGRRIVVVGRRADVDAYVRRYQPWERGIEVAAAVFLDEESPMSAPQLWINGLQSTVPVSSLEQVEPHLRRVAAGDIVLVIPMRDAALIEAYVQMLLPLPSALYLATEPLLDRLVDRLGNRLVVSRALTDDELGLGAIPLVRRPMTLVGRTMKRTLDIVGSLVGLLLLSPLFAVVAVAIKLNSPGPVLYRQARHGFNQRTFTILKFRSMTQSGSTGDFRQATRGDARVTSVGRFIRRTSIDELPQLWNVLMGDMSLVGPRPHAIAHNNEFMTRIADYARRHHVKPGITGWAQVNGYRGETDTEEKMRHRVQFDQAYIDRWSLMFDIKIVLLTVLSRKTYRNAF